MTTKPCVGYSDSLGIYSNFKGKIKDEVDSSYEEDIQQKIDSVDAQEKRLAESFIKADNNFRLDECPVKGMVVVERNRGNIGSVKTIVSYDSDTKTPRSLFSYSENGTMIKDVKWDKNGVLESVKETRNLKDHIESLNITRDDKKNEITYCEGYILKK